MRSILLRATGVLLVSAIVGCAAEGYDRIRSLEASWNPYLAALGEPGLCESSVPEAKVCRLILEEAFEPPTVFVVTIHSPSTGTIVAKTGHPVDQHAAAYDATELANRPLHNDEIAAILNQLGTIEFVAPKPSADAVEDGSFVYLEAVERDSCRNRAWVSPREPAILDLIRTIRSFGGGERVDAPNIK